MSDFLAVDVVKTYLGLSDDSENDRLALFTRQALGLAKNYVGYDFEQTSYPGANADSAGDSGYYWGNGNRFLLLRHPYVTTATVRVDSTGYFGGGDDPFAAATALTLGTDFVIRYDGCLPGTSTKCSKAGVLERIGGVWPDRRAYRLGSITGQVIEGIGNIKVTYTAGLVVAPPDLEAAICGIVAWMRRNAAMGGLLQSESWEGYSYSVAAPAMGGLPELGSARQALARYRMPAI